MYVCSRRSAVRLILACTCLLASVSSVFASGFVVMRGGNTPTVWFYEIALQRWSKLPDLPVPVGTGGAMVVGASSVYVLRGGGTGEFYKLGGPLGWTRLADIPEPVTAGSALAANLFSFQTVFAVTGGSSTLWQFDISTNTWASAGTLPMAGPGTAFSFAANGGFEALLGGNVQAFSSDLSGVFQSNVSFPNQTGTGAAIATLWNSCVFALPGGANGNAFYSIHGSDCGYAARAPFPVPVAEDTALISATEANAFVYATGGAGSSAILRYTVTTDSWAQVAETPDVLGPGSDASEYRSASVGFPITYPLPSPRFTGTATLTVEQPALNNFGQLTSLMRGESFPMGCETSTLDALAGSAVTRIAAFGTSQGAWAYTFNFPPAADTGDTYRWAAASRSCSGYILSGSNPGASFPRTITLRDASTEGRFSASATSLTFPPTPVGTLSAPQTITITNSGTGPLLIRDIAFYGGDVTDFVGGSCGGRIIEPGQGCAAIVRFRPTADGLRQSAMGVAHTDGSGFTLIPVSRGQVPDTTAPSISCSATPDVVWPPNGTMVPASIAVDASDADSGLDGYTLVSATSSDGGSADIEGFTVGTASTNGTVRAARSGAGTGRIYSFIYRATDKAGNSATCTATITIPHDQRK